MGSGPNKNLESRYAENPCTTKTTSSGPPSAPPAPQLASDSYESERPPSAYHDLDAVERSYASAVDPDLIVDALRRSRGNVSAAARYLGKPRALVVV